MSLKWEKDNGNITIIITHYENLKEKENITKFDEDNRVRNTKKCLNYSAR